MTSYAEYYGAVFPAAADVLDSAGDYGPTGADTTPTYHAPAADEVVDTALFGPGEATPGTVHLPEDSEVLDNAVFGPSSGISGRYHAPSASEVLDTASFGPSSGTSGTYHAPLVTEVIDTASFGVSSGQAGTVHLPDAAEVLDTATYGAGSAVAGTYHAPLASEVIDTASFGVASGTTGTVHLPSAGEVIDTASFGPASGTDGTYHVPLAAEVLSTVSFGVSSGETGTVVLPDVGDVRSGTTFGPGSSLTGTLVIFGAGTYPPESQVLTGNDYGPNDNDFSGSYVAPSAASVLTTTFFGDGSSVQGTVALPIAEDVEAGVFFGPGSLLVGTLVVDSNVTPADIQTIISGLSANVEDFQLPEHSQQQIAVEGDDWEFEFTGLGSLVGRSNMIWVMKSRRNDKDANAILYVDENSGLITQQGNAAGTASDASLTVTNQSTGTVRIRVKRSVTSRIRPSSYADGLKVIVTDATTSFRNTGEIKVIESTVD